MELNEFILWFGSYFLLVVCVLISVAFFTLLERKVLGYIQLRKGPNKVSVMGLLQPFSDAISLFCSEHSYPLVSNFYVYSFCPLMMLFLSLFVWLVFPFLEGMNSIDLGMLFFFCVTSMGVYPVMLAGWSSNSVYALIGGLRAVAQTISYEVSMILLLLSVVGYVEGYWLGLFSVYQDYIWFMIFMFPLFICWFVSCLAETNRTPFDLAEGESELVSGFNIEYSSGGFALIFMAEYSSIMFMSMMTVLLFLGGDFSLGFYVKMILMMFSFIWVRGTLPRMRYDKLMNLTWKSYLPLSLNMMLFYMGYVILMVN
nr:NADH dehydrogenase subunit 1 [Dianemobius fascipes nigrofasciatus]